MHHRLSCLRSSDRCDDSHEALSLMFLEWRARGRFLPCVSVNLKHVFAGFNAWTDVNYAAYTTVQSLSSNVNLGSQTDQVAQYIKAAANAGFNTVRVFGHGNSSSFALQTGPGESISSHRLSSGI